MEIEMNFCSINCFCDPYITVHFVADSFKSVPTPLLKGGFFERITVKFTMPRSCNQNKVMSAHAPKDINLFFVHITYYLDETIHSLLSPSQTISYH